MRTICRISAFYLVTLCFSAAIPAFAQAPATAATPSSQDNRPKISFDDYLNEVVRHNLDLAIQRSSIAISQAGVTSAKERPDWSGGRWVSLRGFVPSRIPHHLECRLECPYRTGWQAKEAGSCGNGGRRNYRFRLSGRCSPGSCGGSRRLHRLSWFARYSSIEAKEPRRIRQNRAGKRRARARRRHR